MKPKNPLLNPLQITSLLHYKEDKSLQKVTVECHQPKVTLKRSDSAKYRKPSVTTRNNYQNCFALQNVILKPGKNEFVLDFVATQCGIFKLGQVSLVIEEKLEFLSNALLSARVGFEVVTQGVNVYLNKLDPKKDLVAGLEQQMELVVTSGSMKIDEVRFYLLISNIHSLTRHTCSLILTSNMVSYKIPPFSSQNNLLMYLNSSLTSQENQ